VHVYVRPQLVGLELPIVPVRHEYFITEPTVPPTITPNMPVMRIPGILLACALLQLRKTNCRCVCVCVCVRVCVCVCVCHTRRDALPTA
jgi:hypothetical protein